MVDSGKLQGEPVSGRQGEKRPQDVMGDRPVFDKGKADLGIHMACEQFDKLGLTLTERWWVCRCIGKASAAMLGERFVELAEGLDSSEPVDVALPAGVGGGVADDGADSDGHPDEHPEQ